MRDARMFVLIDGKSVGVGGPSTGGVVVSPIPLEFIADGAVVSYRWESGRAIVVGALTLHG